MAAEALTPVDAIGMPLPLAPITRERHDASPENDWHHHFHPKKHPTLTGTLGGRAVRAVRLQRSDWFQHHIDYHGHYFGPPLPETAQQQFGLVVLASAGYVPEHALTFQNGEPEIVAMTRDQRQRLWAKGDLRVGSTDLVRNFLIDYTLNQNLVEVNERLVDEFLNTPNMQRRHYLGGVLLQLAIERATEPIDPYYRMAWKRGFIPRKSSQRVQRLIKNKLQYKNRQSLLIDRLEESLAA